MWLRRTTKTINKWPEEKFIKGVMECYERHMGYTFDINHPVLFTEKLQWYKVFYRRPDFGNITDKYLFKQWVKDHLGDGYTIPCFGVWTNFRDLERDWINLPEEFVLKANLSSDGRGVKVIHKKSETDFKAIKKDFKRYLTVRGSLVNSWDWHFYDSTPKLLAEQYMANFEDQLYDYKFFCFDGKPHCMYVATGHFKDNSAYPITFYNIDWQPLDVKYGKHGTDRVPKPKHYDEMVVIAEKLSKGFPFVRVDFFDTDDKLYVAELTFAPGGGVTPYNPESFNRELGDLLLLPGIDF